ncbi:unnamed protein product [marine sediment metagenome]|uniref:Uncharacterized protein n=1 Tax=marine sediment metagenome TaxID=412755 RepID=X1T5I5_9ZZZZ
MKVSKVVYLAEGPAKLSADYIRLKMTLVKGGVDQDWTDFDGDSKTMNERTWSVAHGDRAGAGIEADQLRVEAFDLEIDSHILEVDGKRILVPLTGALKTATYRFPL